jgi:phosphoserine phosphatase
MKFKEYSLDVWKKIDTAIADAKKIDPKPIAAFDADGTLWNTDLGEMFFKYKISNNLVPLSVNPWQHYHELKKKNNDPREAYLWLAQVMKGQKLSTVQTWATQCIQSHSPLPIFPEQQKLIQKLLAANVQIYIVTASVKWAVEPGAKVLGLENDNVIGITTEVTDGIVSENPSGIITYRQGKADAILQATGGKKPFLASGNSIGDFELLKCATHLKLCVSAATMEQAELLASEKKLFDLAATQQSDQWVLHYF